MYFACYQLLRLWLKIGQTNLQLETIIWFSYIFFNSQRIILITRHKLETCWLVLKRVEKFWLQVEKDNNQRLRFSSKFKHYKHKTFLNYETLLNFFSSIIKWKNKYFLFLAMPAYRGLQLGWAWHVYEKG